MGISLFLAKIFGIFFIADALFVLLRWRDVVDMVEELKKHKYGVMVLGVVLFIIGELITISHNIWVGSAFQITISIIGWIILLKGLFLSLLPVEISTVIIMRFNKPVAYWIIGVVELALGFWLTISGFVL